MRYALCVMRYAVKLIILSNLKLAILSILKLISSLGELGYGLGYAP